MTPPPLSRERVVAAALAIVDRDGLDALTMRGLGRELDADPMAAYHHVPNKDAVLDGVVEAVWADIDLDLDDTAPWQEQLTAAGRAVRAGLGRHPNALPVLASRPNVSRPGFRVVDHILGVLLDAGLPPRPALEFVNAAGEFLLGHALVESSPPPTGDVGAAAASAHEDEALPHLSRVLAAVDVADISWDAVFEAGLQALVAGIEHRLATEGSD